jgi:hypothetical protein
MMKHKIVFYVFDMEGGRKLVDLQQTIVETDARELVPGRVRTACDSIAKFVTTAIQSQHEGDAPHGH